MSIFIRILIVAASAGVLSCAHPRTSEIASQNFTAENIFTGNIEGPAFDKAGKLYVVNYQKDGTIGYVNSEGEAQMFLSLPQGSTANSIQFNGRGDMLLADFTGHNVLRVDMNTRVVSVFYHDSTFNQPNDLCVNSRDQIFASDPDWKNSRGKIWRIEADATAKVIADSMGTTNGIVLSPDERFLYVNESVQRNVWIFDVDEKGEISNKRLLIHFDSLGMDGMKCDRDGNLYITRYGKGVIAVVTPAGQLIKEVELKGKNCSNLVFGGPENKTVYVTLQDRKGMEYFVNDIPGAKPGFVQSTQGD